jgi:hypothetical protein
LYGWIWSRLPGSIAVKSLCAFALVFGVAALLWFVIFPWAEPLLPFGDVTVGGDAVG